MNLKKIQELEKLNIEIEELSSKVRDEIFALKKRSLNQSGSDFEAFFKDQGFSVSENDVSSWQMRQHVQREITAKYGKQLVTLYLPSHEVAWFGSYSIMELHLTGSQKGEYKIKMNPLGSSMQSSFETSRAPQTEDEKLDQDIKKAKAQLEELKEKVGSYDNVELGYQIFDQAEIKRNPRSRFSNTVQYKSITELLSAMFES